MKYVPLDFIIMDIESHSLCNYYGKPFLRIVGAIIDIKKENHIPIFHDKLMEHFPRKRTFKTS